MFSKDVVHHIFCIWILDLGGYASTLQPDSELALATWKKFSQVNIYIDIHLSANSVITNFTAKTTLMNYFCEQMEIQALSCSKLKFENRAYGVDTAQGWAHCPPLAKAEPTPLSASRRTWSWQMRMWATPFYTLETCW